MTTPFARIDGRARRSSWLVWAVAAGVYFFGLVHRASLGVAGPDAVTRLGISATELGAFVMVQLGLYAFMQVPAGLAIDRWGARRVLLVATLLMGSAQLLFAVATSYPVALGARALLGVGDAAVFIGVLRIAAMWFPHRRYAVLTTFTGLVGMAGNLVATVPLVVALDTLGWTRTFALAGATSLIYALFLLRPAVAAPFREVGQVPDDGARRPSFRAAMANVPAAWRRSETRLGFWIHQAAMATGVVISLVWGFPYLTQGLGYSSASAASQLSLYVVGTLVFSLFIGPLAGRRPTWRAPMGLVVALVCVAAVMTLAVWPGGRPPGAVVSTAFVLLALGGPASQIGFHVARDYNPAVRISTASGLVNAGGFLGAMVMAIAVGVVLDISSAGSPVTLSDYRWAMGTLAVLAAASTTALLGSMLKVRSMVLERIARGEHVVVHATERWWDRGYRAVRVTSASGAEPQAQGGRQEAEGEGPGGVAGRGPAAVALGEAHGVEARGAEGGVSAEQPGAQDDGELPGAQPADDQPHDEGTADVDDEQPPRESVAEQGADDAVDEEPQHGPDTSGECDEGDHRPTAR